MREQAIHQYIHQFFLENSCRILEKSQDHLTVQLTIDMDKRIMNRPFYWSYVESGGVEANPAQLTFVTNPTKFERQCQENGFTSVHHDSISCFK